MRAEGVNILNSIIKGKAIRRGNQFVKKCSVKTNNGVFSSELKRDKLTVTFPDNSKRNVVVAHVFGQGKTTDLSPKDVLKIVHKNFERFFDPSYEVDLSKLFPKK